MMESQSKPNQGLAANIWKYYFLRIFTKRIIVPVLVVYLLAEGLSATQIGVLFSFGTILGLIFEVPSGILSDKLGHKNAIATSFFLQTLSMLAYALGSSFFWFGIATALYAIGVSFWTGTGNAFAYETLK